MNGAEDAIRVRRERHFQGLFSNRFPVIGLTGRRDKAVEESFRSACEEQHGSRSQASRLQTYDAFRTNVRASNPRRVDFLPSRKRGPRITVGQKDEWTVVLAASSEPTRGENNLISRTKIECSPSMPGPGSLKFSLQALHEPTLMEKSARKTLDNSGTDTKLEISSTIPFPGSNSRSPPYHRTYNGCCCSCIRSKRKRLGTQ